MKGDRSNFENDFDTPDVIELPITDTLDLHTFKPGELPNLLDDWLTEVKQAGFKEVRIIHGKGQGILKKRTHSILGKHPLVESFNIQPNNHGATEVILKS